MAIGMYSGSSASIKCMSVILKQQSASCVVCKTDSYCGVREIHCSMYFEESGL